MMRTDTELLDALQVLNDRQHYTGKCILRESMTGRGWRFHETGLPEGFEDIREAILTFIDEHPNAFPITKRPP